MSRKTKTLRAFLHQNPNPTIKQAWDVAWERAQKTFHARSIQSMEKKLSAVQAECEELRKDAERYRWLRDYGFQHAVVCLGTDFDGDNFVSYRIDFNLPEPAHMKFEDDEWGTADVDAAIDAAMEKEIKT